MKNRMKIFVFLVTMLAVLLAAAGALAYELDLATLGGPAEGGVGGVMNVSVARSVTRTEQERDASFTVNFAYDIPPDRVTLMRMAAMRFEPVTLVYDLTDFIGDSPLGPLDNYSGRWMVGPTQVGTYTIRDNKVTFTVTNTAWLMRQMTLRGSFSFDVHTDASELGLLDEYTYDFPGSPKPFTVPYKKVTFNTSKTVNGMSVNDGRDVTLTANADGTYTLNYSASVTTNATMKELEFSDTLSGGQALDTSSVRINGTAVTPTSTGNGFKFNVHNVLGTPVNPGVYTVTYSTTLTESQLNTLQNNTANWKVNGNTDKPGGETSITPVKPTPTPTPSPTPAPTETPPPTPTPSPTPEGWTPTPVPTATPTPEPGKTPIPASKSADATWEPGGIVNYTLTFGDATARMGGKIINDRMTDLQVLVGDVTITYADGSSEIIPRVSGDWSESGVVWSDDGVYSTNEVNVLNGYKVKDDAPIGPITITYSTTIIDRETASAQGIYDIKYVKNHGDGDGTGVDVGHNVEFEEEPGTIKKTVDDTDGEYEPNQTLTYTITFGHEGKLMDNTYVDDYMSVNQTLEGNVTVTLGDGSSYTMPTATGENANDGVVWGYHNITANAGDQRVFGYQFPAGTGYGPITITFTARVLTDNEASDLGVSGQTTVRNKATYENKSSEVSGEVPFTPVTHTPEVDKYFMEWDRTNNKVYFQIDVYAKEGSVYPLTNVVVTDYLNGNSFIQESSYFWGKLTLDPSTITVKTDSGAIMAPGQDYSFKTAGLDQGEFAKINFPVLNEGCTITLGFDCPKPISDGVKVYNDARVDGGNTDTVEEEYKVDGIDIYKYGEVDEETRIITWHVILNPTAKVYDPDTYDLRFTDTLAEGMELYGNTITVNYQNSGHPDVQIPATETNGVITSTGPINYYFTNWDGTTTPIGISGKQYQITYQTKISDAEWDRITSSQTASKDYDNEVNITTESGDNFEATAEVSITAEDFLEKRDLSPRICRTILSRMKLTSTPKDTP